MSTRAQPDRWQKYVMPRGPALRHRLHWERFTNGRINVADFRECIRTSYGHECYMPTYRRQVTDLRAQLAQRE